MESFKKIQIFHFKKYFWQNVGSCLTYSAVCQTDTVSVLWLSSEKPGWAKKWRRQKRCWWARLVMPAPLSRAGSSLCSAQSYPGYSPNFFEPQFWSCLMNLIQSEHFAPTNTDPILNHLLYFELGKRYHIVIEQSWYWYQIIIDGKSILNIENSQPRSFSYVKLYASTVYSVIIPRGLFLKLLFEHGEY